MVRWKERRVRKNFFIISFIFFLGISDSSWGAIPSRNKPYRGALFYETSKQLVTKQQEVEPADQVYKTYFESLDSRITLLYQAQWQNHEQTLPFRSTSWRGEFISNSAQSGTYDWEARQQFAQQVFRMRVDQGIREAAKTLKNSHFVAKAQSAIEALKEVSVPVSSDSKKSSAQLRMGYDLITDSSKIEYVGGAIDMGVYKSAALAEPGNSSRTLMNVSSDLGPQLGRASLSVPFSAESVQASLSKQLSPTVSTSLSSTQPLKTKQESSYQWQLAYSF